MIDVPEEISKDTICRENPGTMAMPSLLMMTVTYIKEIFGVVEGEGLNGRAKTGIRGKPI